MKLLLRLILLCCIAPACRAATTIDIGVPEPNTLALMAQAVLQRAYAKLDIEFRPQVLPLHRALLMAEAGELDGDLMRNAAVLKDTPNLLTVHVPVAVAVYSVYRRGDCPARISAAELADKRVAYFRGIRAIEMLLPPQALLAANNSWDALRHVQQGITEYAIGMQNESDALLASHAVKNICRVAEPISTTPLFHALNKRHASLVPRLEAVLREMDKQGEIARIWAAEEKRALYGAQREEP
jgi:polar amino acid transport system substrate-binding protein